MLFVQIHQIEFNENKKVARFARIFYCCKMMKKILMPLLPHYVCLKALMLTFFVGSKKDMFYALDPCSMLMPFP